MKDFAKGRRGTGRNTKCNQKTMWILPNQLKSLTSASAPDTEASTLDLRELSQACAQSLMQRSKPSRANFFLREWKAGRLMRLQSGAISSPSRGQRFLDAWTSSLAVIPASHSQPQESGSEPTTSDTSGHTSQMAFGFFDPESASSKTSKDTSALGCEKSLKSWKDLVTARRGEYSLRRNASMQVDAQHRTSASGSSSWPTAKALDLKDTTGCSLDAVNPDGTHRNRRDRLVGAIAAEMSGLPAQEIHSTDGSRRELWPTPDATGANDGVPWEKFEQGMQERRAKVKAAVAAGQTKQGSGRSANLCAAIQNPKWNVASTSGKLNPRWVEALMGLPIGWTMSSCAMPRTIAPTSFGCWATESSPLPQQKPL
jgi:hypothetical protein